MRASGNVYFQVYVVDPNNAFINTLDRSFGLGIRQTVDSHYNKASQVGYSFYTGLGQLGFFTKHIYGLKGKEFIRHDMSAIIIRLDEKGLDKPNGISYPERTYWLNPEE